MIKVTKKSYKKGNLILDSIQFDHVFKRTVMKSGPVAKVYLPRELIGKTVFVVADLNGLNGNDSPVEQEKEAVKLPKPVPPDKEIE